MGCFTNIYKKVTTTEECLRLIENALKNANDNIEFYSNNREEIFGEGTNEDFLRDWDSFMNDVKQSKVMYDPDDIFCYMVNGQWITRFDLTYDDVVTECMGVIARCQAMLSFPLLKSFDELKNFIIENSRFWGFSFDSLCSLEDFNSDEDRYNNVIVYNDEIYVSSISIQRDAFSNCKFFRVYGYPCEEVYGEPCFYRTSPAGKPVYGWTNAEDLIEFLEWYKSADLYDEDGKLIENELPVVVNNHVEYGEELYSAILEFFEVNKNKNLLVNFS